MSVKIFIQKELSGSRKIYRDRLRAVVFKGMEDGEEGIIPPLLEWILLLGPAS